jgi:hypothetical protein
VVVPEDPTEVEVDIEPFVFTGAFVGSAEAADTGWVTPLPSTSRRVELTVKFAGTLLSIEESEVFAVVWFAEVAAPEGRGREAADTGWVTAEPSTFRAVIEAIP